MGRPPTAWLVIVALVALAQVAGRAPTRLLTSTSQGPDTNLSDADVAAVRWLNGARAVQEATRTTLQVIDQPSCADASFVSYRRSDAEPTVADQWYVASQLWADSALLSASVPTAALTGTPLTGDDGTLTDGSRGGGAGTDAAMSEHHRAARCLLAKGFLFLDRLRDAGGYYPRAALDGSDVVRGVYYADDNAVIGLSLLAAAEVEADHVTRQQYLDSARSVAAFLATSGLWDDTFGGGFWWNSNKGDRREGKPSQANALAALFFARLAAATGDATYGAWASQTLDWLDAALYDPSTRLYRWSVRYQDPRNRSGDAVFANRYFNYDQAIAIEAQIMTARLDGRTDRLDRARDLGHVMHAALWNNANGGYHLEIGIDRIYASYGAWASFGHLALYDLDGDPAWLDLATLNANALDALFRQADGGYGYRQYRCTIPGELARPGCEGGEATWVVDQTRDGAAQAWMQHLQGAIARRVAQQPQPTNQTTPQLQPLEASSARGPGAQGYTYNAPAFHQHQALEPLMQRIAFTINLSPAADPAEYKRRHDDIWPEMVAALRGAGIRNYNIFLHNSTLFAAFETDDFDKTRQILAQDATNARWQEYMRDMIGFDLDPATGFPKLLPQMFHMD